jgi:hypothetical protein
MEKMMTFLSSIKSLFNCGKQDKKPIHRPVHNFTEEEREQARKIVDSFRESERIKRARRETPEPQCSGILDPLNPLSPISPLNPINSEPVSYSSGHDYDSSSSSSYDYSSGSDSSSGSSSYD